MRNYVMKSRDHRSLISRGILGACVAGTLALTGCGGSDKSNKDKVSQVPRVPLDPRDARLIDG